jgi:hypothetical protein
MELFSGSRGGHLLLLLLGVLLPLRGPGPRSSCDDKDLAGEVELSKPGILFGEGLSASFCVIGSCCPLAWARGDESVLKGQEDKISAKCSISDGCCLYLDTDIKPIGYLLRQTDCALKVLDKRQHLAEGNNNNVFIVNTHSLEESVQRNP